MKKCVIYSRVSSTTQDYQSQINDLVKYSKDNGYKVEKIFSEKITGTKEKLTPEFQRMKEYVIEKDIKDILIWEISRFSRNMVKSIQEIQYFTNLGITIHFKKENLNTSDPSSKFIINIMNSVAENERDTIVGRTSRGLRESAKSGKRTGLMTLPYGYKADENSMLVIDEEEAKVIELIFKLADDGTAQRSIAQHLNSIGIQTRWTKLGRRNKNELGVEVPIVWKPNAIGVILKNTLYKGIRKYKNETFQAPKIIDTDLWDRVQTKTIKKVGYMLKETKYQYLLKGKIQCGICGRNYGCRTELRYGKEESYYACNGAKDLQIRCKNGQFSGEVLDTGVFDLLLSHKDFWLNMRKDTLDKFNIEEIQSQIEYYIKELKALESKREKSVEAFTDSLINKPKLRELINKINLSKGEYEFKVNQLTKKIDEFNRLQNNTNTDEVIGDWLQDDSYNNRKDFIDRYLNKVVMFKYNKEDIDYKKVKFSEIKTGGVGGKLTGRDKVVYLEIYAFNSSKPLKCFISNDTKLSAII
jgi:DNA invertase Pin-like site-specific DNA recombinase